MEHLDPYLEECLHLAHAYHYHRAGVWLFLGCILLPCAGFALKMGGAWSLLLAILGGGCLGMWAFHCSRLKVVKRLLSPAWLRFHEDEIAPRIHPFMGIRFRL